MRDAMEFVVGVAFVAILIGGVMVLGG